MNRRWGALLAAFLMPCLAGAAPASEPGMKQPMVVSPSVWRPYANPAYCYTINLPASAAIDSTDPARVRITLSRAGADGEGREVVATWKFDIIVAPNPRGVATRDWLEEGSGTPVESSGLPSLTVVYETYDATIGRRAGYRKQVEGADQRREVFLVSNAGHVYALSYPALDLAYPRLLQEEMPTIRWVLATFALANPGKCTPGSGRP